jgi:DNA end-binding protein Ku
MAKRKNKPAWPASWKGQLRLGLVSLGVEAVNARSAEEGDIHFHQLHKTCHHRIHYQKVCPVHGEVDTDEIVLGYEQSRNEYVEIDPDEVDALRTDKEKALTVESTVDPAEVDPIYFDGRMYYLLPAKPVDQDSFAVLTAALERSGRWGVGHFVMSGKDQIAVVRAKDGLMHLALLNFAAEIRKPSDLLPKQNHKLAPRKVKLAEDLLKSHGDVKFDIADYEDRYRGRLTKLIEAKIAGHEIAEPEEEEEKPVVNFLDALQQSIRKRKTVAKPSARHKRSKQVKRSKRAS